MTGKVLENNDKDSLGYIEGYDGNIYIFHYINVQDNVKLKEGDIVKFNFSFNGDKNMLYAFDLMKY